METMSLVELVPALQALSRADKLRVIQLLAADLAREESSEPFSSGAFCPVWSPFDAFDAARILMQLLEQEQKP
jgi:hypothetical protein